MNQPMMTPPMPHRTVRQIGMLSLSPGATNLPSRPMMMAAMMTPMISMGPSLWTCSDRCEVPQPPSWYPTTQPSTLGSGHGPASPARPRPIAVGLVRWFYPCVGQPADHTLDDVVVPHGHLERSSPTRPYPGA